MQLFRSLSEIPAQFGPTVASIGNFDGVHLGHQAVLARVRERAQATGRISLAITFDPHPERVLRPETGPRLICRLEGRIRLLAATGIDALLVLPFNAELSQLRAAEFARQILVERLKVAEVHEGTNFRFGYRAEGGVAELAAFGAELGYAVEVHQPLCVHGMEVSSSLIRLLIAEGDVRRARWLLGRPFTVVGEPARGRGLGTRLTVPTINLAAYPELLPAKGVYVSRLQVDEECFDGVTNVGDRPTFGEASFAVETHLLNFRPVELAPETRLRLSFLARIRDEVRWPSPEALKAQIGRDISFARRYLRQLPAAGKP